MAAITVDGPGWSWKASVLPLRPLPLVLFPPTIHQKPADQYRVPAAPLLYTIEKGTPVLSPFSKY